MAQPKVQLVAPIGNINLPGMTATGVVTATSLSGIATGSVTNLTGSPDLDVGIVTGSSFVGDGTGHAASLTGTPNLNLGLTTATSFVGDAVGKAAGLTGTPNLNVGLITATSFVGFVTGDVTGNISGLAVSVTPGVNLGLGVCTAIQYHGDGSGLSGAGSSAYIAQEITASGAETIIDLSYGNLIYYQSPVATTVGFASTSAAEQITFIRDVGIGTVLVPFNNTFSSGGVVMDGTGDYLSLASSSDLAFGTGDFTMEGWFYWNNKDTGGSGSEQMLFDYRTSGQGAYPLIWKNSSDEIGYYANSAIRITGAAIVNSVWYHIAASRQSGTTRLFINGVSQGSFADTIDYQANTFQIGALDPSWLGNYMFNGIVSNVRLVKGTGLYTEEFIPPSAALTNITNTKLLCCQSTSSTTTAAVTPGTITANGDPTAGSQSINVTGTNTVKNGANTITWPDRVTWNGGTAPTLISNSRSSAMQIFHFTTVDTGLNYNAWEEMKNNAETFGLYGAGSTGYGALGNNEAPDPASIKYSSPVQVGSDTTWSSLAPTGFTASAIGALKSDGTFWVWGKTNMGILGLNVAGAGLGDSVSSPIQLGTENTWDNVCFGGNDSAGCMAVKTDGTLWSWGMNNYGTLGLNERGGAPNYPTSRSSPTQVGTDTTWKWVNYAGDDSIFAIKTNGTLWSWGGNSAGAAGQNTPATTPSLRSSPVQVGTDTSWAFACGGRNGHTIATKTDGTLWCWGDNSKGAIGQNNLTNRSSPTQVGSGTDWNYDNEGKITAGYQRVFAIKTDGTLYGWGRSHQGQLGLNEGGYKDYSSPVQIPGTNWATISSVSEVIATKTDGTLWTWGDNGTGLGMLNSDVDRSSPTQVPGTWSTGGRGIMSNSPTFALKVE